MVLPSVCVKNFQLNDTIEWMLGAYLNCTNLLHFADEATAWYQYNNFYLEYFIVIGVI